MSNQKLTPPDIHFFDIGNTRTKWCKPGKNQPIFSSKNHLFEYNQAELIIKQSQAIVISAGRSQIAQNVLQQIKDICKKYVTTVILTQTNHDIFQTNYTDEKQFGSDRFLNLIGAKSLSQNPFVVVSLGTAITLDFYQHQHLGGMILPGINALKTLLSEKANLSVIDIPQYYLGDNTQTSIGSGIYYGIAQLILGSITEIEQTQNQSFDVFITGGDADLFQKILSSYSFASPIKQRIIKIENLLFIGMELYYNQIN